MFRDAFVMAQQKVTELEASLKRMSDNGSNNFKALVQTVERGTQSIKQGLSTVNSSFNSVNDALRKNVVATSSVAGSAGNARMAYMELGHIARSGADALAAGANPFRVLAFESGRAVQAFSLMGIGLAEIGVGFTALLPLIVTGAFAWRAHAAAVEEAATKNKLLAQTQHLIALNQEHLNEAVKKEAIKKEDADYIESLLKLGTTEGLRAAQSEMQRLGISPKQIDNAEKFRRLLADMKIEALDGLDKEQARADYNYQQQLKEIRELAKESVVAKQQQAEAEAAAKSEHDAKTREIQKKTDKLNETHYLKELSDDLAKFEIDNSNRIVGKAQQEFEMEVALYGKLRDMKIITEERYQELWDEGNTKRLKGIKDEQDAQRKVNETVADVRAKLQKVGLDGIGAEIAAIDYKYDKEIERVKDLKISLEEELGLIDEINAARERDINAVKNRKDAFASGKDIADGQGTFGIAAAFSTDITADAEKRSAAEQRIRDQRVTAERNMWQNLATIAKAFGKEGFIAYKAMMIGLAVADTARNAILGYQRGLEIPYAGAVLAPIFAAAAIGAGAIQIATIAAQSYTGYQAGGYTGDGPEDRPAGIVHFKEVVIPAPRVRQLGRGVAEAIAAGNLSGLALALPQPITSQDTSSARAVRQGISGSGGSTPNVNVEGHKVTQHFWDRRPHPKDYLASSEGKTQIIELFRQSKLELGFET